MRLGVGFWSGVNPGNIDNTLQRLARIGVKGIGHIAAHNWHPEQWIHPGNRGPLDAPAQLRRLLDDVASPRLKVILDPVNMTTHRTYYNTTAFLNYTFDLLGPDIVAAHAKDVSLDISHWVTKLDEVPLGMGQLDYETYLKRLGELDEDVLLTIEHYRDVGVSGTVASPVYVNYPDADRENTRAHNYIHELAQKVGVAIHQSANPEYTTPKIILGRSVIEQEPGFADQGPHIEIIIHNHEDVHIVGFIFFSNKRAEYDKSS